MNKISVIVPCYKVEEYLPQCIDSIIGQTYKNLEIILVDDGSPDKCPLICDEYAQKDSRIKVIHKENGGLSSARNAGLDIATGDYIAFVDSDDWLELDMYETLYNLINNYNVDIAVCDIVKFSNDVNVKDGDDGEDVLVITSPKDAFMHQFYEKPCIRFEVWNKLFRREIVSDIRFKEGQIYEDIYFDKCVFQRINRIAYIPKYKYCYRINRPGGTNSFFKRNRFALFDELDGCIELFDKNEWKDLSNIYKEYAYGTCLVFYQAVLEIDNNTDFKNKLKEKMSYYYNKIDNKSLKTRLQHLFFTLSPMLYLKISNAKNKG